MCLDNWSSSEEAGVRPKTKANTELAVILYLKEYPAVIVFFDLHRIKHKQFSSPLFCHQDYA